MNDHTHTTEGLTIKRRWHESLSIPLRVRKCVCVCVCESACACACVCVWLLDAHDEVAGCCECTAAAAQGLQTERHSQKTSTCATTKQNRTHFEAQAEQRAFSLVNTTVRLRAPRAPVAALKTAVTRHVTAQRFRSQRVLSADKAQELHKTQARKANHGAQIAATQHVAGS